LKVFTFLSVLLVFLISCSGTDDKEQIKAIRQLEFQRSDEKGAFDKFIADDHPALPILVVDAIAKIGYPVHVPVLLRLLEKKEPELTEKIIFALGQITNQDSILFSMLENPQYHQFQNDIITALGCSKKKKVLLGLTDRLPADTDSLKSTAIQSISFIAGKNDKNPKLKSVLRNYLKSDSKIVREAAAYFFSRHPYSPGLPDLIRMPLDTGSLADKYRLKAISRSLVSYYRQPSDSALFDTLYQRVVTDLEENHLDWHHQLYELAILKAFEKESGYLQAIPYLKNRNPHLRKAAIETLSASDSLEAKNALLRVYPDASWADKGYIIIALSQKSPDMTYSLIQQNLDKGDVYFKQLLLRSLAEIRNRMSINQLKQFLQVPNTRLRYTAFEELWKLRYIGYQQSRDFLLSGDPALSTLAAGWISEHSEWVKSEDITSAYALFKEPADVEVKCELLNLLSKLQDAETDTFFAKTYRKTTSSHIARQIEEILLERDVPLDLRKNLQSKLHVPDSIDYDGNQETINVLLVTAKGEIVLQLYPAVAPATAANFVELIKKGFYDNLTFHRVVSDFVIQGGDPRGDGWGGPGYTIPCEYNEKPFLRGTLGMATSGKDTGGSQFFICLSDQPHLNRHYTVFGQVIKGGEIIDIIEIDDTIKQMTLLK